MAPVRPGGELATRPLHFIWIVDCSGSMGGDKIKSLNFAIAEALPAMRKVADENPNANILVRAVKFSDGAQWHVAQPTSIESFRWMDLSADGVTDLGKALKLVAEQLKMPPMEERALPPVLVLLSDGQPTDDYSSGLNELMSQPWGQKSVRIAIAIGGDAHLDILQKFIGNPEIKPLQANNSESLVKYIKWASTVVLKSASSPKGTDEESKGAIPIPTPPPPSGDDVW
ncbi:MAG: vWA domain-containing protein [Syntrophobacteraceae bacterium]